MPRSSNDASGTFRVLQTLVQPRMANSEHYITLPATSDGAGGGRLTEVEELLRPSALLSGVLFPVCFQAVRIQFWRHVILHGAECHSRLRWRSSCGMQPILMDGSA